MKPPLLLIAGVGLAAWGAYRLMHPLTADSPPPQRGTYSGEQLPFGNYYWIWSGTSWTRSGRVSDAPK